MSHSQVPSAPVSRPWWPSDLRRVARIALAVVLGSATLLVLLLGGVAKGSAHTRPPTAEGPITGGRPINDVVEAVRTARPLGLPLMRSRSGQASPQADVEQQHPAPRCMPTRPPRGEKR